MPESQPYWLSRLPRVFRHRNYRVFFAGQSVALMGTWMQTVALGWLVYRLSHSTVLLGVVTFATQAPIFFVTPFAGTIADRMDRRSVFIVTRSLCMLQAVILTALTLMDVIDVSTVIVLSLAVGIITAIETPVRQSFTFEMVGRDDLRQAIAYNAMMFNFARTLGPALGGVVVAVIGEGLCFLLATISYTGVLISLLAMRLERRETKPESRPLEDLKQGFAYVTRHPHVRMILFLSAVSACFGTSYLSLLPAFTKDILHEGSDGLGYVMACFGIGAFTGAAMVARMDDRRLAIMPTLMAVALGVSLILFANARDLGWALLLILPSGFAYLGIAVSSNTQVQVISEDHMRGRVMAYYAMGALGSPPMGALLLGYMATYTGLPNAFMFGGVICLVAAAISYFALKRQRIAGFVRDIAE